MNVKKRGGNCTSTYTIYKYDLDGNFIREFDSLSSAEFIDDLHTSHLIANLKGETKHYKKFIYSKIFYLKYPKELLPIIKTVYQYDLNGNFIREFDNPHQIEDTYNVSNIYTHLEGRQNKCGNFMYSYEKKDKIPKWINPNTILKSKQIVQYDLKGKFIKLYDSAAQASKELNIACCIISKICLRRPGSYQSKGFIFRFYEGNNKNLPKDDIIIKSNKKPVIQYTLKGKKIKEFESGTSAIKETGITTIWDCISGKASHAGGFIFKYK
jgi:hypothetical protein